MNISMTEDQRVVVEEYKSTAVNAMRIIKQNGIELSMNILIQMKVLVFQFVLSYKEYSINNIREYGLGEILLMRALRFFRLDISDPDKDKHYIKSVRKTRRGVKQIILKTFKTVLLPFYLILLLMEWLRAHEKRHKDKSNKNVKNKYTK